MSGKANKQQQCGFCGKSKTDVQTLFTSENTNVCNECVSIALTETLAKATGPESKNKGAAQQTIFGCSFCGTQVSEARIYRRKNNSICQDCVLLCAEVLLGKRKHAQSAKAKQTHKFVHSLLQEHFADLKPEEIVTAVRVFPIRMQADLQIALDNLFKNELPSARAVGLHQRYSSHEIEFAQLWEEDREATLVSPLQFIEIDVGDDASIPCLKSALWLMHSADGLPHTMLLSESQRHGVPTGVHIEIAVPAGTAGDVLTRHYFARLEQAVAAAKSYRGKVLSLERANRFFGEAGKIQVHKLREIGRDEVILPQKTLELLDRNVFNFFAQREGLAALNFSVKKGLLFYGPPGTGKTHSIHYLAARLKEHTTLLITAEQIGLLPEYMALARLLQPSIVVIEDADLIARDRTEMGNVCDELILNQLLNEMDGLKQDAEILFILTTNRPETLEPALASRPGRIDQSIEFPLPDADCRRRLAQLYARGIEAPDDVLQTIVDRTDRASGALIKELMRRAAQYALEQDRRTALQRSDVESALQELVIDGGRLNAALLGAAPAEGSA